MFLNSPDVQLNLPIPVIIVKHRTPDTEKAKFGSLLSIIKMLS